MSRARLLTALVIAVATLAAPARAAIPAGNLITNPGAEASAGATDSTTVALPTGWTASNRDTTVTAVAYGTAGGFPTASDALMYGGGTNLFAGGPQTTQALSGEQIVQRVDISGAAAEINSGGVVAKLGGCLGGYADQDDYTQLSATPLGPENQATANPITLVGPTAAQRGNQTELVGRSAQATLAAGTVAIGLKLTMLRTTDHGYNDGYADNLSLTLRSASDPETSSACAPALTSTTPPTGTATPSPTATPAGTPFAADLHLSVGARNSGTQSGPLPYIVRVTNRGPDTAQAAVLSFLLPKGTQVVKPPSSCAVSSVPVSHKRRVLCPLGDLTAGQFAGRKLTLRSSRERIVAHTTVSSVTGDPVPADNTVDQAFELGPGLSGHVTAPLFHDPLGHQVARVDLDYKLTEDAKLSVIITQKRRRHHTVLRDTFDGKQGAGKAVGLYSISDLHPGRLYRYTVTARDGRGLESSPLVDSFRIKS